MASQAIEFKAPVKGVNKDVPYSDFPQDFALDASNVLPFDTAGRRRISQRTGTSKVYSTQMGGGANVKALQQATIPLDTSVATATNTALDEPFTYSNGSITTVSSGRWIGYYGNIAAGGIAMGASSSPAVSSNALNFGTDASSNTTAIRLAVTPDVGTVYTIKFDAVLSNAAGVAAHGITCAFRWTFAGSGSEDAITLKIARDTITLGKSGTTYSTLTPGGTPFSGSHSWEVRVRGDAISVYQDGVLKLGPSTTTDYNTRVGFGMCGSRGDGSDTNYPVIDNYQILVGDAGVHQRQVAVVAVAGGSVYQGDSTTQALVTTGSAALSATVIPGVAWSGTKMYFVDGTTTIKMLNLATKAMATFTATAGSYPTSCKLACMYRDRLVLAGQDATPHIWYMSRSGTHTDWDYTQTDAAAAVAGTSTGIAGKVGEPIVALIPGSDDILYLCGDHNIWAVRGDPAATNGGSIDLLSDGIGIAGPTAWTKAPDGTLYFIGNGALYKTNGVTVENLSTGKYSDFFHDINRGNSYINLAWDRDRNGLFILVTPTATTTAGTHLWYDAASGGLWPIAFPVNHGPVSAMVYDGDLPADRAVWLGTRDGYVQQLDEAATSDDGTAISSYVYLGPVKANEVTGSVMEWLDLMLGESSSTAVTATVQTGTTVEGALNSARVSRSRSFTSARRMTRWLQRIGGVYFLLKLANSTLNKTFSYEKAVAQMLVAGDVRRR